jgi:hypothetical protein
MPDSMPLLAASPKRMARIGNTTALGVAGWLKDHAISRAKAFELMRLQLSLRCKGAECA